VVIGSGAVSKKEMGLIGGLIVDGYKPLTAAGHDEVIAVHVDS